jgi:hypothetical protein
MVVVGVEEGQTVDCLAHPTCVCCCHMGAAYRVQRSAEVQLTRLGVVPASQTDTFLLFVSFRTRRTTQLYTAFIMSYTANGRCACMAACAEPPSVII